MFLYVGEVASRASTAVLILVLARGLGPVETGKFIFASSLAGIAMVALDYGPVQYYVREAMQNPISERGGLLLKVIAIRCSVAVGFAGFLAIYALAGTQDGEIRALLLLAGLSLPPLGVGGAIAGALRARERMGFEGINRALVAGATTLLGAAFVILGLGVVSVGVATLIASAASVAFYLLVPKRVAPPGAIQRFSWSDLKPIARGIWPYFSLSLLSVVYFRIDTIIVEQVLGSRSVGEYGVAIRVMEVGLFVPLILGGAMFPAIARGLAENAERVGEAGTHAIRLLVLGTIPIAALGGALGPIALPFVFGPAFHAAGDTFGILIWTVVPLSASIITSTIIGASRRPIVNTYFAAAMVLTDGAANLAVVPVLGINGSAGLRIAIDVLSVIAATVFINTRITRFRPDAPLRRTLVIALAAAVISAPLLIVGLLPAALVFTVLYVLLHARIGAFSPGERMMMRSALGAFHHNAAPTT